ncbi:uncharacterized protein P884DRAFT_302173 [Thermothelomyces heterothallicus CBS 202.75]|uniref:uncharacterized protein n=1 Tax=Thermothelomyces heterothallicus CBS 202.75 TaxID=1149848 RepID=UPI00374305B8
MPAFVVTVPEGVLLYHVASPSRIEHAELFAHAGPPKLPKEDALGSPPSSTKQHPLSDPEPGDTSSSSRAAHGYLHTYLTTSPIPLLYLDGSSAGAASCRSTGAAWSRLSFTSVNLSAAGSGKWRPRLVGVGDN